MSFLKCNPCIAIKDLGCVAACGPIELPLYAPMNGVYQIYYWFRGAWLMKEITINAAPERIVVDNFFPENAEVIIKIIDPNGYLFKFSVLRDVLGVKDLQNADDDCCTGCITHFRLKTEFTYQIVDEVVETLVDPCDVSSVSS